MGGKSATLYSQALSGGASVGLVQRLDFKSNSACRKLMFSDRIES